MGHRIPRQAREEIPGLPAEFGSLGPAVLHGWQDGSGIPVACAARLPGVPRILISIRNMRPTNLVWYRPHMSRRELAQCQEIVIITIGGRALGMPCCWPDSRPGLRDKAMKHTVPRWVTAKQASYR